MKAYFLLPFLLFFVATCCHGQQQDINPTSPPVVQALNPQEQATMNEAWSDYDKGVLKLQLAITQIQLAHKSENWQYNFPNRAFYIPPTPPAPAAKPAAKPASPPPAAKK